MQDLLARPTRSDHRRVVVEEQKAIPRRIDQPRGQADDAVVIFGEPDGGAQRQPDAASAIASK